jgi:hypothetical protein
MSSETNDIRDDVLASEAFDATDLVAAEFVPHIQALIDLSQRHRIPLLVSVVVSRDTESDRVGTCDTLVDYDGRRIEGHQLAMAVIHEGPGAIIDRCFGRVR